MRVFFDPSFDRGAWPGPLAGRAASAGEAWAGTLGLLNLLETALGLTAPPVHELARAAGQLQRLRQTDGFWRHSFEADPLGTAQELLFFRDALHAEGWDGAPLTPWLAELQTASVDCTPGISDRWALVHAVLNRRPRRLFEALTVFTPLLQLPARLRGLLAALGRAGTLLHEAAHLPAAPPGADLAAVQSRTGSLAADGTVQLLRATGPLAAAEQVAVLLSSLPAGVRPLLIGPDAVLDAALRRHALPVQGGPLPTEDDALLQLLPLCLDLGWNPPNPRRAVELFTLPVSPIPGALSSKLLRALQQWPAVGNDGWARAFEEGLVALGPARRARVEPRVRALLTPAVPHALYPVAEASRRVEALRGWLRSRLSRLTEEKQGNRATRRWRDALGQLALFERLLLLYREEALTPPQLRRFVEAATSAMGPTRPFAPEAGLSSVSEPAAVCGPVDVAVWWSFSLAQASRPRSVPLASADRAALAAAGVRVPDAATLAARANLVERRPLIHARRALLLVAPRRDAAGAEAFPHPLWDEVRAKHVRLERGELLPLPFAPLRQKTPFVLAPLPSPTRQFFVEPGILRGRDQESPSSLETLLGCSLKWVLHYEGRLHPGAAAELPSGAMLRGSLAHELLARVLRAWPLSAVEAEALALELFDREGPLLAAELFLPGAALERTAIRGTAGAAARVLARTLEALGLEPVLVEQSLAGALPDGATLEGKLDLLVRTAASPHRHAVIDLKLGSREEREKVLTSGTSVQLSSYSALAWKTLEPHATTAPPVAYFLLSTQQLLTQGAPLFGQARALPGPPPEETWRAVLEAASSRRSELTRGELFAPGNPDEAGDVLDRNTLTGGRLTLAAPCRHCSFQVLCGRRFPAPAAVE